MNRCTIQGPRLVKIICSTCYLRFAQLLPGISVCRSSAPKGRFQGGVQFGISWNISVKQHPNQASNGSMECM